MTIEALQTLIEQCGVHPAVGLEAGGWGIEQNAWELARFLYVMQELGVSSVLEIGTGAQAGLSRFMHEHMHWHVTTVDKNGHYGDYPGIEFVVSDERRDFGDRRFDLVIIDGDHAYASVKADHEWYGKYATKAVMFHDIAGLRDCEGAARYWGSLCRVADYNLPTGFHEIINRDSDGRCGIGWYEVEKMPLNIVSNITGIPMFAQGGPVPPINDTPELRKAIEESQDIEYRFGEMALESERPQAISPQINIEGLPAKIEITILDDSGNQSVETVETKPKRKTSKKAAK